MAHSLLSSDMAKLINAMRLAQQYSSTALNVEYRGKMLQAAHVLALDSKNLFDAVDGARRRMVITRQLPSQGVVECESSSAMVDSS